MTLRRFARLEADVVASYVHNAAAPNMGKIGVLVGLNSNGDRDAVAALGKQIAMHVAATSPASLSEADLDPALVEHEKQVLGEQARASGKPEEIIAKMVEGRLRKFYEEVVLLEQVFVMDTDKKIAKVLDEAAKDIGAPVTLSGFVRFELGEGVEKTAE